MAMTNDELEAWMTQLSHVADRLGEDMALHTARLTQHDAMLVGQARVLARIETKLEQILGHVQGRGNGTT